MSKAKAQALERPKSIIERAIEKVGGTRAEVAAKLGTSESTLYRILRRGYVRPERDPKLLVDKFVDLSGFELEDLSARPVKVTQRGRRG